MKIAQKRKAGEILKRDGIAQRIIAIASQISQGSYKEAMEGAGRIAELVDAASYDDYWDEKVGIGRYKETGLFVRLAAGEISRDRMMVHVNANIPE